MNEDYSLAYVLGDCTRDSEYSAFETDIVGLLSRSIVSWQYSPTFLLVGKRGTGKSWWLTRITSLLVEQGRLNPIYLDVSALGTKHDLLALLAGLTNFTGFMSGCTTQDLWSNYACSPNFKPIILILDNIHTVFSCETSLATAIIDLLHIEDNSPVIGVIAGLSSEFLQDTSKVLFFESISEIPSPSLLTCQVVLDGIIKRAYQYQGVFTPNAISLICEIAFRTGNMHTIRLLVERAFDHAMQDGRLVTSDVVNSVTFRENGYTRCGMDLHPLESDLVRFIASDATGCCTSGELHDFILDLAEKESLSSSRIQKHVRSLKSRGYISSTQSNHPSGRGRTCLWRVRNEYRGVNNVHTEN